MKKIALALALVTLPLGGCAAFENPAETASSASVLAGKALGGLEISYKAANSAMSIAADSGVLDSAGRAHLRALDNAAYAALVKARAAYKAADAAAFKLANDATLAALADFAKATPAPVIED